MKHLCAFATGVCLVGVCLSMPLAAHTVNQRKLTAAERKVRMEKTIQQNLEKLPIAFPERYAPRVKQMIRSQLTGGIRGTQSTLGRTKFYFPIFEYYLAEYDLPEELKYIPFVESRLRARAESPAGAKGLWQFMDYTAREQGLVVNEKIDERMDPIRSTEGAMKYLSKLYDEFDDWLLAMAAYNCGPGNVRKAMRLANSKNYWELEYFLPRQTRSYIPSFIAAMYVVKYHGLHGLNPKPYRHDFASLQILNMHDAFSLHAVAQMANLPLHTMRQLNPGYAQEVVSANKRGNYLILPDTAATRVTLSMYNAGKSYTHIALKKQSTMSKKLMDLEEVIPIVKTNTPSVNAGYDWKFLLFPTESFLSHFMAYIAPPAVYLKQKS